MATWWPFLTQHQNQTASASRGNNSSCWTSARESTHSQDDFFCWTCLQAQHFITTSHSDFILNLIPLIWPSGQINWLLWNVRIRNWRPGFMISHHVDWSWSPGASSDSRNAWLNNRTLFATLLNEQLFSAECSISWRESSRSLNAGPLWVWDQGTSQDSEFWTEVKHGAEGGFAPVFVKKSDFIAKL